MLDSGSEMDIRCSMFGNSLSDLLYSQSFRTMDPFHCPILSIPSHHLHLIEAMASLYYGDDDSIHIPPRGVGSTRNGVNGIHHKPSFRSTRSGMKFRDRNVEEAGDVPVRVSRCGLVSCILKLNVRSLVCGKKGTLIDLHRSVEGTLGTNV